MTLGLMESAGGFVWVISSNIGTSRAYPHLLVGSPITNGAEQVVDAGFGSA